MFAGRAEEAQVAIISDIGLQQAHHRLLDCPQPAMELDVRHSRHHVLWMQANVPVELAHVLRLRLLEPALFTNNKLLQGGVVGMS